MIIHEQIKNFKLKRKKKNDRNIQLYKPQNQNAGKAVFLSQKPDYMLGLFQQSNVNNDELINRVPPKVIRQREVKFTEIEFKRHEQSQNNKDGIFLDDEKVNLDQNPKDNHQMGGNDQAGGNGDYDIQDQSYGRPKVDKAKMGQLADKVYGLTNSEEGQRDIIQIILTTTTQERDEIALQFKTKQQVDIKEHLKKIYSGDLENLVVGFFMPYYEYWADMINGSVKGAGTDEEQLIDLVLTCTREQYKQIDQIYTGKYKETIKAALIDDDAGKSTWGQILRMRIDGAKGLSETAEQIADILYNAAKGMGTDEKVFERVFGNIAPAKFQQVIQIYHQKYKKSVRDVINAEFSGHCKYALWIMHDLLISPPNAVATILKTSMQGTGTDEEQLNYVTILFSERYRKTINKAYTDCGHGDLKQDIISDTSKAYQKALLAFWGF